LKDEPKKGRARSAAETSREVVARSTQERVTASVERSKASSSKVQLGSPRPSDLEPEVVGATTSQPETIPVQTTVLPHSIELSPQPKHLAVGSDPITPIIPIIIPKLTMATSGGFKKPYPWERNSPSFDGKTASSLKRFLRHCKAIVKEANITDVVEQKTALLDYINDDHIREQFEKLSTYTSATFEEWCKDIESLYPEIEDMGTGSLENLIKICTDARKNALTQHDLGAIRRFNVSFSNEAEKLLRPPASVTNKMLVELILDTFERGFANNIELIMNQKLVMDNTAAAVAPTQGAPAQVPVAGPLAVQRRGDRLDYKLVLETAEKIADSWTGRSSNILLSGLSNGTLRAGRPETSLLQGGPVLDLQREVTDKLDAFSGELASLKDSAVVQEKQFKESLDKMENALKDSIRSSLVQYTRGPPPHMDLTTAGGVSNQEQDRINPRYTNNSKQLLCFFCLGPHLIRDCPYKDDYINMGWLRVENGRMNFGDGGLISKYPEWKSKKEHIDDHYAAKGITKDTARRGANLMQSQEGYFNPYIEDDNLDQVYDSRADELRSRQVQMTLMNNVHRIQSQPVYNQQAFSQGLSYSQGPAMVPQAQPMMPQTQGQFIPTPVIQTPVASQPGVCNITADSLAQLLNLVNTRQVDLAGNNESTVRTGSQEQFISTRSGRTIQGSPGPNF
jgi:hypothetical protein